MHLHGLLLMAALKAAEPTAAPALSPAAEVVPPSTAPAPVPSPAVTPAALPKELAVGTDGFFKPALLFQGWAYYDQGPGKGCAALSCVSDSYAFRLRRAEFGFSGNLLGKRVGFKVNMNPAQAPEFINTDLTVKGATPSTPGVAPTVTAKQPPSLTTVLSDVYVTYSFDWLDVQFGQYRIPISWEGYNGSSKLMFPERSTVARFFGDTRDLGAKVGKSTKLINWGLFLFDGSGTGFYNESPTAPAKYQKEFMARFELYPLEGLMLAVADWNSVIDRYAAGTRDRVEFDARYEAHNVLFQSEFIRGWDRVSDNGPFNSSFGWYAALGYTLAETWQPVIRVGNLDPLLGSDAAATAATDETTFYEIGLNWFINKHETKLQLAYSLFQFHDKPNEGTVILNTQISY